MKRKFNINLPILAATLVVVRLLSSPALAGVPLSWSVDVTRVEPVRLDAYHGETLELSATLMQGRRQLAVPAGSASFLWQTNGMGAAWWQTNATVSADGVVRGTFGATMDTGADSVRFFFSVVSGSGANYRAAGMIALRASPGATPTTADLAPQTAINFADYQLVNAPWLTATDAAESVRAATNALATVLQASDNALSSAIADAAQAATNYADSVAAAGNSALVAATNALAAGGSQLVATAAQAASNYTDAAVAAIDIPSLTGYATETWTHQAISNALPVVPSLDGYATEAWVQGRGYLTEHQSLAGYATEAWTHQAISNALPVVPSLAGYATEAWVQGRGYLTEHQPLTGYATEAWVQGRGYLTDHQSLSGYATEAWTRQAISNSLPVVPSLDGYATEAWVTNRGYITEHQPLTGYATEAWVQSRGYLTEHQPLAGYATEAYATDAATGARSAAEAYARSLSWGASAGNTRLVTLDGSTWQDATGTVWQISYVYGWAGTVIDLPTTTTRAIRFDPVPDSPNTWAAGGGTNLTWDSMSWILDITNSLTYAHLGPTLSATNLTFETTVEKYYLYYSIVSLVTNPVDRVLYASSGASGGVSDRALSVGTPTRWTDATGCVWEVSSRWVCTDPGAEWTYTIDGETYTHAQMVERADSEDYSNVIVWDGTNFETSDGGRYFEGWFVLDGSGTAPVGYDYGTDTIPDYASDPLLAHATYASVNGAITATRGSLVTVTNLITRVAYTNDTAPLAEAVTNLQVESALVYRLYSGSNVVAEVTNYNSQVHAPELRLMQLNESNEYVTVWTETNGLARTLKRANEYTDDATGAVARAAAPRAWSRTTSGLGAEAPSNTTWISTPTTVIAGGFEYAKFVDTYGEVWVLTSNGMAAEFNPDTNAYFRITADDGTPIFSVEKSDAQLVGANAAGITVGESSITIPVPVVSSTAPTMCWSLDITTGVWADESSPPTGATVTWSGTAGSWVCTVSFSGTRPSSMFFKFNFLLEGGVVIRNNATTDLSTGILVNGVKFVPSVSGNNLIWTKQ